MWEAIDKHSERLKVPGGWIVRSWISYNGSSVHQIFIADVNHAWELQK